MQSLSSMLSPLNTNNTVYSDDVRPRSQETTSTNFQTPLTITIPPIEYDIPACQFNQQPLLTSKSPELDALVKLNKEIGNQYTYQMFDVEKASNSNHHLGFQNDPRMAYDKIIYTSTNKLGCNDFYYQCAYGEPKTDRMAIRHKLDNDDIEPAAKRHCAGELDYSRFGNERSVVVQNTNAIVHQELWKDN